MKAMSKFWTALVVGVAVMAVTIPSWAGPLTTITPAQFAAWTAGGVAAPPKVSTFDFSPLGTDGDVASVVFFGADEATGLFVYVYQITHYAGSSELNINGMSFDLLGPVILNPSLINPALPPTFAFQVSGTGDVALNDATTYPLASPSPGSVSFTIPTLPPGKNTLLFGFFSPVPPTTVVADLRDTDRHTSPLVYTPSPEPSVGIMFGLGLLGIPIFGALRRRFTK
jgi:hypothetical protein